jgi:hypothetical protein
MKGLDARFARRFDLRPAAGPFDCMWCKDEARHERCTGKALRPHLEGAALLWPRRVATAVERCACELRGHDRV